MIEDVVFVQTYGKKIPLPDRYPCKSCPRHARCSAAVGDCPEWRGWFHLQWRVIQKAGGVR